MSPFIGVPNITVVKKDKSETKTAQESGGQGSARPLSDGRRFVNGVSATAAVVVWVAGLLVALYVDEGLHHSEFVPFTLIPALLVGLILMFAIKVVDQWEKAVILRFGKYRGLRGPGLFWLIPVVDVISHLVDQRVRATDVTAESALTRDTVPVNVDAIVFWLVWDAEKAVLEVQSFFGAIFLASQTALREAIGRHDLAEMITEREKLGQELQRILDEKTNPWGITVQSVEIRDVRIPAELEDAMSRRAQAERERQARIILGTAETEIAQLFAQASEYYRTNQVAMHLRAMNMLYEAIKEKGSMVIVPSSAVETMGLGGMLGTTAIAAPQAGEGSA
jgi:regulator of protease activity HflC (stomatin/prohibitin superfamily)